MDGWLRDCFCIFRLYCAVHQVNALKEKLAETESQREQLEQVADKTSSQSSVLAKSMQSIQVSVCINGLPTGSYRHCYRVDVIMFDHSVACDAVLPWKCSDRTRRT